MENLQGQIEPPRSVTPPGSRWQTRARQLLEKAQASLWSGAGTRALAWLRGRGLSDDTIKDSGLGYVPRDTYEEREVWGLAPKTNATTGKPSLVWVPKGLTMPWYIGDELWRVNIRRSDNAGETPKYYSVPGYGHGLYGADRLEAARPAMMLEGELDVLAVLQEAGDLIVPVATGGADGSRRGHWVAKLAMCSVVLMTFDSDDDGEQARRWWLHLLDNGRYWRPYWDDVGALLQDGVDVRKWVSAGL